MAYDKTVPNESNLVRTSSGDIAKMRENFEMLEGPAVSGIEGLSGVDISSPASGEILGYDGSDWKNQAAPAGDLSGLDDTNISSPASGEILGYDGADWVNQAAPAGDLSGLDDTNISSPASGEILGYDGADWVNQAAPAETLAALTDTDISSPASGEFLVYNGSDWVNSGISGAFRGALVTLSGDLLISGGDTTSGVVFDQEVYDSDGFFTGPSSGLIIPSALSGSYVVLRGQAAFLGSGVAADTRGAYIKKDGADFDGMPLATSRNIATPIDQWLNIASAPVYISGGEVFSLWVENEGAVDLYLDAQRTWFSAEVSSVQVAGGGGGASSMDWAMIRPSGATVSGGAGFVAGDPLPFHSAVSGGVGNIGFNAVSGGIVTLAPDHWYKIEWGSQFRWSSSNNDDRVLIKCADHFAGDAKLLGEGGSNQTQGYTFPMHTTAPVGAERMNQLNNVSLILHATSGMQIRLMIDTKNGTIDRFESRSWWFVQQLS